jgi:hypothetical protein
VKSHPNHDFAIVNLIRCSSHKRQITPKILGPAVLLRGFLPHFKIVNQNSKIVNDFVILSKAKGQVEGPLQLFPPSATAATTIPRNLFLSKISTALLRVKKAPTALERRQFNHLRKGASRSLSKKRQFPAIFAHFCTVFCVFLQFFEIS